MLDRDRKAVQERYLKRWREFGLKSRTLGWNKDCQWVRFEALLEDTRLNEIGSILDVGCGFADLLGFLRDRGWRGRYTGVDLMAEFTEAARALYADDPEAQFVCGDLQALPQGFRSDAAVAIGIFNHRVAQGNLEFIRETIDLMWQASTALIVCDFLSDSAEANRREANLYYADVADIQKLAAGYSRRYMVHHAYMPFEFQLKIWHDDTFEVSSPTFAPYRHLAQAQTKRRRHSAKAPE